MVPVSILISQKPFDQGYETVNFVTDFIITKKRTPNNKIHLPIDILIKENVDYNERNEFAFENKSSQNNSYYKHNEIKICFIIKFNF